jgi:xanthine dehydrogenase accessory factor
MDWTAVIDARMRKHAVAERQRGIARLTVGLGPNFVAGGNVDLAVETSWDNALGGVISAGHTVPLARERRATGRMARARFVYAPVAGRFETTAEIGDCVAEGDVVAAIEAVPLSAPTAGIIRGLTRSGVPVTLGTKVLEVDPRGNPAAAFGLGERPYRIARGVLAALSHRLAPACLV